MKLLLCVAVFAAFFYSANSVAVICYYASWSAYDGITPDDFDASLCTHVNYAFITIKEDGNLKVADDELDINRGLYKRVTGMKDSNPNLKVLLSVGGGGVEGFGAIAKDASKRATLVGSATYFVKEYNFDGLDFDWEYPENDDRENYITLLKELREAFEPNGWLLTAAVSSYVGDHGYNVADMVNVLDFINVMTYDFYGPWSKYTGQNSALYASDVESDWEKGNLNVAAGANNWFNAGAPKNKLTIGTGFYGRSFTLSDSGNHGLHAGISGPGNDGGEASYLTICSKYDSWTRVWDDQQKNPYRYSGDQWIGYDDKDSIWAKAAWIKENGFFGVMVWAINQDDVKGECGEKQILLNQINKAIA